MKRPSRQDYVGAGLLVIGSGLFSYIVMDQIGAALICAGCVGVSLLVANNL